MRQFLMIMAGLILLAAPVFAETKQAHARLMNPQGEMVGEAVLTETLQGVLLHANLFNLPSGWHAFHIHGTGQCTAPDFKSAGGHFNPAGKEHGYQNPQGFHMGDLPNVYIGKDGSLQFEALIKNSTLEEGENRLLDADGAAIVMHEGRDDYATNPAGDAGKRMACGVIIKQD